MSTQPTMPVDLATGTAYQTGAALDTDYLRRMMGGFCDVPTPEEEECDPPTFVDSEEER